MESYFFETLLHWPRPYICGTDLHHILSSSPYSRQGIVKRNVQKGYLIPVKRDLYFIKNSKKASLNKFEIASIIYGPAYISFESALSYHSLIPEAVRTTTCATVKRSKEFDTAIGIFSYEHIPIEAFPFGVEQHLQNGVNIFIASPLKALADIIYARKRSWQSIEELSEDLRIDIEQLQSYDGGLCNELIENYPSKRVKKTLGIFQS